MSFFTLFYITIFLEKGDVKQLDLRYTRNKNLFAYTFSDNQYLTQYHQA